MIDITIMSYAILMGILVYQAEKLPENSLKVILIGLFFTPILGFLLLNKYRIQFRRSSAIE